MDDDIESFKNIVQVDYYTPMLGKAAFYPCKPENLRLTQLHYNKDKVEILERAQQLMARSHAYEHETPRIQALLAHRQLLEDELERLQTSRSDFNVGVAARLEVRKLRAQLDELNNQLSGLRSNDSPDRELDELRKMNIQLSEFNDAAQLENTNLVLEQSNLSLKLEEIALIEAGAALLEEKRLMEPEDFAYVRQMQRADLYVNGQFMSGYTQFDYQIENIELFDIERRHLLAFTIDGYSFTADAREIARTHFKDKYEEPDWFCAFQQQNNLIVLGFSKHDWLIWTGVIKQILMLEE